MSDIAILKMTELLHNFKNDIIAIQEDRNVVLFKQARLDLHGIYDLHLSSANTFAEVDHYLKNLYTSFNFLATVINDFVKKKKIDGEKLVLMDESIEVMIKCCDVIIQRLNEKPNLKKKGK